MIYFCHISLASDAFLTDGSVFRKMTGMTPTAFRNR